MNGQKTDLINKAGEEDAVNVAREVTAVDAIDIAREVTVVDAKDVADIVPLVDVADIACEVTAVDAVCAADISLLAKATDVATLTEAMGAVVASDTASIANSANIDTISGAEDSAGNGNVDRLSAITPAKCDWCPLRCGANRVNGKVGLCGADNTVLVARSDLHFWEEPPISGITNGPKPELGPGSGTVFFSNCNMKCVYCQNFEISGVAEEGNSCLNSVSTDNCSSAHNFDDVVNLNSTNNFGSTVNNNNAHNFDAAVNHSSAHNFCRAVNNNNAHNLASKDKTDTTNHNSISNNNQNHHLKGKPVTLQNLAQKLLDLQNKGAMNINFVTGTHYRDQIIAAVRFAKKHGLNLPIVWNSSGYETRQSIKTLSEIVNVWLPDFKYANDQLAQNFSANPLKNYSSVALDAIEVMLEVAPKIEYDNFKQNKRITSGIIVRHMLLPGHVDNSMMALRMLYERFGNKIMYSIMNQYTPCINPNSRAAKQHPELLRTPTNAEYEELLDYADKLGIQDYFWQEGGACRESFIPEWD